MLLPVSFSSGLCAKKGFECACAMFLFVVAMKVVVVVVLATVSNVRCQRVSADGVVPKALNSIPPNIPPERWIV